MRLKARVQIFCGDEIAMGPGKAQLLAAIDRTGSISAAAREMQMSYRRAWMLVDTMNRCFAEPLVATRPGGGERAGATLTELGREMLAAYRDLASAVQQEGEASANRKFTSALRDEPLRGGEGN